MTDDVRERAYDSEFFVTHAGEIRDARLLANAIADLECASHNGSPHEVRLAWLQFYDIAGPVLTGKFIASGAWQEYCPEIDDETDTDSRATLWKDDEKRVVATLKFTHDTPCDMTFTVE